MDKDFTEVWDRVEKDRELVVVARSYYGAIARIVARIEITDFEQAYRDATLIVNAQRIKKERDNLYTNLKNIRDLLASTKLKSKRFALALRKADKALSLQPEQTNHATCSLDEEETLEVLEDVLHHFKGPLRFFAASPEAKQVLAGDLRQIQGVVNRIKAKREGEEQRAARLVLGEEG